MKPCRGLLALILLAFCARGALADEVQKEGRAKFEIFGMMDEYMLLDGSMRRQDNGLIERFYPSESAAAGHFASLLPAYCAEDGISSSYVKQVDPEGFTYFDSPAIAKSFQGYYKKGILDDSVFAKASTRDLVRYVRGAYIRYNYKHAAIISAANSPYKVHDLSITLSKLGCSGVQTYEYDAVPTSYVVIFSPTESLRHELGIHNVISFAELNKVFNGGLKLHEKIGL